MSPDIGGLKGLGVQWGWPRSREEEAREPPSILTTTPPSIAPLLRRLGGDTWESRGVAAVVARRAAEVAGKDFFRIILFLKHETASSRFSPHLIPKPPALIFGVRLHPYPTL